MSFWDDELITGREHICKPSTVFTVSDVLDILKANLKPSELEEFIIALGGYNSKEIAVTNEEYNDVKDKGIFITKHRV